MKKLLSPLILFSITLIFAKTVNAQGTYECQYFEGGGCLPVQNDCQDEYDYGEDCWVQYYYDGACREHTKYTCVLSDSIENRGFCGAIGQPCCTQSEACRDSQSACSETGFCEFVPPTDTFNCAYDRNGICVPTEVDCQSGYEPTPDCYYQQHMNGVCESTEGGIECLPIGAYEEIPGWNCGAEGMPVCTDSTGKRPCLGLLEPIGGICSQPTSSNGGSDCPSGNCLPPMPPIVGPHENAGEYEIFIKCWTENNKTGIDTAIGCIPIEVPTELFRSILKWSVSIAGGIALILLLIASFIIITSSGDPKKVSSGKELFISAISGLLFILFSVFLLKIIGVDILGIF